jgi:hypothetical protein
MTNKIIKHEVKLQSSVIIILGLLALGVCANVFAPTFSVKKAEAAFGSDDGGMIISGTAYLWQLKDEKIRHCTNYRDGIKCRNWVK